MANIKLRDWIEPAHPVLVQRFDDIINIYRFIKDKIQVEIDTLFDKSSRQIGFVVTTTLPVNLTVSNESMLTKIEFATKNLQESVFAQHFGRLFETIAKKPPKLENVAVGSYQIFLIWHEALKLRLKHDWMEPAHFRNIEAIAAQSQIATSVAEKLNPGIREPAHWLDAGIALEAEESILISAIDEVYTDLKLAERIAVARRETLKLNPGIREPAHFRSIIEELMEARAVASAPAPAALSPGIREPAHFRRLLEREDFVKLLTELSQIMKQYGM